MSLDRHQHRQVLRAAMRIREYLTNGARANQMLDLPIARWFELRRLYRRLESVHRRGWQTASVSLGGELDYEIGRLTAELDAVRGQLPRSQTAQPEVQLASAIAADLVALANEFEAIELDLKAKTIRVDTAGIILEDVDLGAFRIALRWERIGTSGAYRIEAITPNCPTTRSDVTHPHVSNNVLCEGAGAAAIRQALVSGRLFDFFVLIRQILETYNPSSPYVALENWWKEESASCHDCGNDVASGDHNSCDRCGDSLCDECTLTCGGCENTICASCRDRCNACDERFCHQCLHTAPDSNRELCAACLKQHEEEADEEECENAASDSVCVGEAAAVA